MLRKIVLSTGIVVSVSVYPCVVAGGVTEQKMLTSDQVVRKVAGSLSMKVFESKPQSIKAHKFIDAYGGYEVGLGTDDTGSLSTVTIVNSDSVVDRRERGSILKIAKLFSSYCTNNSSYEVWQTLDVEKLSKLRGWNQVNMGNFIVGVSGVDGFEIAGKDRFAIRIDLKTNSRNCLF